MRVGQSEPKRGNPALLAVLIVLSLVSLTLYFRESDSGMLHDARRVVLAVSAPVETAGTWVTTPFRAVGNFFDGLGASKKQLAALEAQNEELKARLAELEEAERENQRLQALVQFADENDLASLGARVIGRPTSTWEGVLTINRGSADGVEPGMPVVAAQGLVGQVVSVTPYASTVRLITDQQSGVAAMVQSSRTPGIVRGSVSQELTMEYVDRASLPVVGDVVITSGIGGVYPKGIVIGDIIQVDDQRGELYPDIVVKSRVPINQIEEVLVLVGSTSSTGSGVIE